jgi:hypothetical protein
MCNSTAINTCFNCGKIVELNVNHICTVETVVETAKDMDYILHGPIFGNVQLDKIIQKLDKIIELLEVVSDEDEDKILLELAEGGVFKQLLDEAKMNSSSSDWQKELEDI